MNINLSELSTQVLEAIRKILVDGVPAQASKHPKLADADGTKALKKENADLKREKKWREIVESYGLEFDDPEYWLSFETEDHLRWLCNRLNAAKKAGAAMAELHKVLRVPPIVDDRRSTIDVVREGFRERRRNGHDQLPL